MEKIFLNNRIVVIAFFTVFSAGVTQASPKETSDLVPVELRFVRWIKDQPIFQFEFSGNRGNDEFTITISDEFNNILHKENIRGESFTKSFLLNTDEIADETLHFEIISRKTNQSKVYPVNRFTFAEQKTA